MNMIRTRHKRSHLIAVAAAIATALSFEASIRARVDTKVDYDKTFDFKPMRTWGWNSKGKGQVLTARTAEDKPEDFRVRAEPIIVDAVTAELGRRGLQPAAAGAEPDLVVTYYLLLTVGADAQTMGQFLPGTYFGPVPFAPATQSYEIMNQGALVIDLAAKKGIVWRGIAQAKIKTDADEKKRESVLREAVRDLAKKYPPK
jgi:hypothetical protein